MKPKKKQFLVIGLGRFGASLAKTLCEMGHEVLAVDDDEEVSFEYDTPDYVAGLPRETEAAFMEFYCDAVKHTLENLGRHPSDVVDF